MTNQNAVSDANPGINMAITMAVAESGTASAAQKPPAVPGTYITRSQKKLLQNLDINSGSARINAWLEAMRASSPTHNRSSQLPSDDRTAWMSRHPSAVEVFDEITKASKGKQIVMFLDYDGTLSPIVADPDRAFMSDAMRGTVRKVARYFPTAIVSGRCYDKVHSLVRIAELYYAGSHGMDIKGPSKGSQCNKDKEAVLFQPASEFVSVMDEVYKSLMEVAKCTPGAKVENNKFCLSVHFRCVEEEEWTELANQVGSLLEGYPNLKLTQGRKVLEIRPSIEWNKGNALEFLLEALGYADSSDVYPIYIGDDRTDEDAFKVLQGRGQGCGILVSKFPKDTNASYSLQEPSEVMEFLRKLADWKRAALKQQFRMRKRIEEMMLL